LINWEVKTTTNTQITKIIMMPTPEYMSGSQKVPGIVV